MKTNLLLLTILVVLLACNNFGTRVMYDDSEVFFKGAGVTEKDARALGDFLQRTHYFSGGPKTVQLTHNGREFVVHLVVNEEKMNDTVKRRFWRMQYEFSHQALNGRPTRIMLSDTRLRDLEKLNPIARYQLGKSTMFYDSSALRKAEVDTLISFLSRSNLLTKENGAMVLYQKEKNVHAVRIVVNSNAIPAEALKPFAYVQETMRANVFKDRKARLVLTSAQLNDLPALPELSEQQREAFWIKAEGRSAAGDGKPAKDSAAK